MGKPAAKPSTKLKRPKPASGSLKRPKRPRAATFRPAATTILYIPDDLLIDSPDNPQEMDDATFDEMVEGMRSDGFDEAEPLKVINMYDNDGGATGQYMIFSGHHRRKAGRAAGMTEFPCVIKTDMDDAARKVALVRNNQLRGDMNPKKFTALFKEVAPLLGEETAKRLMGFTKEAAFKKLYQDVSRTLSKDQRKQLDTAKEKIKSVDDLSSVLNGIFKKEGSKVRKGYVVFSFGGKKHHYYQISRELSDILEEFEDKIAASADKTADDMLKDVFGRAGFTAPAKKRVRKLRGKSKKN